MFRKGGRDSESGSETVGTHSDRILFLQAGRFRLGGQDHHPAEISVELTEIPHVDAVDVAR